MFYFVIFVNFAPQILSFIESFVTANRDMFTFSFKTKEFVANGSNVTSYDKYVTIDFSIFMIFLANFAFYVIIPFSVIFIMVR